MTVYWLVSRMIVLIIHFKGRLYYASNIQSEGSPILRRWCCILTPYFLYWSRQDTVFNLSYILRYPNQPRHEKNILYTQLQEQSQRSSDNHTLWETVAEDLIIDYVYDIKWYHPLCYCLLHWLVFGTFRETLSFGCI